MNLDLLEKEGIRYRFANSNDKDSIYAFALDAIAGADLPSFAEDAGHNLQQRIDKTKGNNVLIAEDISEEFKIIGYIELDPEHTNEPNISYIRGIFVLPNYRRRGIGQNMLNLIISYISENNRQLRVSAFTKEGLNFWKNYGFNIHHYALYHDH